jgi:hypothetical protein
LLKDGRDLKSTQQEGLIMAERAQVTRRDVEARLITRAWKDEAFAAELRRNPRAAVEAELKRLGIGATLGHVDVKVVEETPTSLYLVIPPKPAQPMSDAQLEQIAAGHFANWGNNQNF